MWGIIIPCVFMVGYTMLSAYMFYNATCNTEQVLKKYRDEVMASNEAVTHLMKQTMIYIKEKEKTIE